MSESIEMQDALTRADLYRRLYQVTAALSEAALPEEVVSVLFAQALDVLGADAGFIGLLDEGSESMTVRHFVDYSGTPAQELTVSTAEQLPIVVTALDGAARLIESNEQLRCDYPDLRRLNAEDHACASVALHDGARLRGALNVAFDQPRRFTDLEREVIETIARHCAAALARSERLHAAEQELRSRRALAVHDDVVQDLAAAKLALELGRPEDARESLVDALEAAKRIVSRLAEDGDYRR